MYAGDAPCQAGPLCRSPPWAPPQLRHPRGRFHSCPSAEEGTPGSAPLPGPQPGGCGCGHAGRPCCPGAGGGCGAAPALGAPTGPAARRAAQSVTAAWPRPFAPARRQRRLARGPGPGVHGRGAGVGMGGTTTPTRPRGRTPLWTTNESAASAQARYT